MIWCINASTSLVYPVSVSVIPFRPTHGSGVRAFFSEVSSALISRVLPPVNMPGAWTRKAVSILIEFMKTNELLWKFTCKTYHKRDLKASLINKNLHLFRDEIPEVDEGDVSARIKSLKDQFYRERRKLKKSSKSGAGLIDIYAPTLWCYEQLQFLADGEITSQSHTNLQPSTEPLVVSIILLFYHF